MKVKIIIGRILIVALSGLFLLHYCNEDKKTQLHYKKFSEIINQDSLKGKVSSIEVAKGAVCLITLVDSNKIWLHHSKNYNYNPNELFKFLKRNDSLIKYRNSDTIFIVRNDSIYVFRNGEYLNK